MRGNNNLIFTDDIANRNFFGTAVRLNYNHISTGSFDYHSLTRNFDIHIPPDVTNRF